MIVLGFLFFLLNFILALRCAQPQLSVYQSQVQDAQDHIKCSRQQFYSIKLVAIIAPELHVVYCFLGNGAL